MLFISSAISILEVVIVTVSTLLTVAFITIAERKTMGSMQRRVGPNIVGYYGILQPFADALKLLIKEFISPSQANLILFFLGPIITLIFALYGYAVIPYGPGLSLLDFDLGILYMLAVSSIATYGILLAGWSANSKYAFLGSLRSTAQLISYELILSSAVLLAVLLGGGFNLTTIVESQKPVIFFFPLLPIFIIFFIAAIAETNRAPFDLAEAESELVSGFMTEHSAVIFVFFFLAEYASIILMCILLSIVFLGGYTVPNIIDDYNNYSNLFFNFYKIFFFFIEYPIVSGIIYSLCLGIKSCILIFSFIWVRASYPRIRFDELMTFCWTKLLPILIAFIIFIPCLMYSFNILPITISLL